VQVESTLRSAGLGRFDRGDFRNLVIIVLSVGLVPIVALAAACYRSAAADLYGQLAYYFVLGLLLFWIGTVTWLFSSSRHSLLIVARGHAPVLLTALVVATTIVCSVPSRFRVLSDETNVLSVSQDMVYRQTVYNRTLNKRYFGVSHLMVAKLDPRPPTFPFYVHLFHLVRGYRPENVFWANATVLFGLLAVIGIGFGAWKGQWAGVAAVLLSSAPPIVALTGRSAGFDLFASFWVAASFASLGYFLQSPSKGSFALLAVNSLVMVNTRYESAVLAIVILAGISAFRKFHLSYITDRPLFFSACALFLCPLAVQRVVTSVSANTPKGIETFALRHLMRWSAVLVQAQGDFSGHLPYAPLLNWVALGVAIFFGAKVLQGRNISDWSSVETAAIIMLGAVVAHLLVILSFYSSDYTHAVAVRYFINVSVLAALAPLLLLEYVSWPFFSRVLVGFALGMFVVYHSVAMQDIQANSLEAVRRFDVERRFLSELPDKNVLIISTRPGQVGALEFGAVDFKYANSHPGELMTELRHHLYTDIYVFQRIFCSSLRVHPENRLGQAFELETAQELQTTKSEFVRISRLVANGESVPTNSPASMEDSMVVPDTDDRE
jgi:hypothetical protein